MYSEGGGLPVVLGKVPSRKIPGNESTEKQGYTILYRLPHNVIGSTDEQLAETHPIHPHVQ